MCLRRHGAHAATATTAAAAGLPHGSRYAAEHAGNDGNEFWWTNAPRRHAHAGENVPLFECTCSRCICLIVEVLFYFYSKTCWNCHSTVSVSHNEARLCFDFSCFCVIEWDGYWDADSWDGLFGSATVYGYETCRTPIHRWHAETDGWRAPVRFVFVTSWSATMLWRNTLSLNLAKFEYFQSV